MSKTLSAVLVALLALAGVTVAPGAALAADGASVTLWLRTDDGMPVTQSYVDLFHAGTDEVAGSTASDADGATRYTGLAAGEYVAVVRDAIGLPAERSSAVTLAPGEHAEVTMTLTAAQTIRGSVLFAGKPLERGSVDVYRVRETGTPAHVTSATIAGTGVWGALVAPGRYILRVDPSDSPDTRYLRTYSGSTVRQEEATVIDVAAGTHATHTMHLVGTASVTGSLRDAQGRPVVGAVVSVRGRFHTAAESGATGADGAFTVHGLAAGSYVVVAADADGIGFTQRVLTKAAAPGGTLRLGAITVSRALPKGSAQITLRLSGAVGTDDNPSVVYVKDTRGRVHARGYAGGEHGRSVRLMHLPAGTYRVYVAGTGWSKKVKLAPGATKALGTVRVPRVRGTTPIRGVVRKANGVALSGATVRLCDARKQCFFETTTTDRGRYTFSGVARGRYTVSTNAWGNQVAPKARSVTVKAGRVARIADLRTRLGGTVTGTVRTPSGKAAARALVWLVKPNGKGYHTVPAHVDWANAKGVFTIKGVPPGTYRVVARDEVTGGYRDAYPKAASFKKSATVKVAVGRTKKVPVLRFVATS